MEHGRVLITGAAGTLGRKLSAHLDGRAELVQLDRDPRGDVGIVPADLSRPGEWRRLFHGVQTVFHFAADPEAYKSWAELVEPNIDALIHTYLAAAEAGVARFVFASSNHVMGGYNALPRQELNSDTPPIPGLKYRIDGRPCDSTPYGAAKLFGERLGKCLSETHAMETIAIRFGWVWRGAENDPSLLPPDRGEWFRQLWLSDRDFFRLMEGCLRSRLPRRFVLVNGMSRNTGMPWDLEAARLDLGYEPQDDIDDHLPRWQPTIA